MNIRLLFFLGGLILFMSWEHFKPFKKVKENPVRIGSNLLMGLLGSLLTKAILPTGLYWIAVRFQETQVGVFNALHLPQFFNGILTIFLMDIIIYAQHVLFHHVPFLWSLHSIHHSDNHLDASSALRFHPVEIILSFGIKFCALFVFGFSPTGLLIFEVLLNFSAMFNHSNFQLPSKIESILRVFIVTPDFHRVHHSPEKPLTNSNYGFFLSVWDTLFGTINKKHFNNSKFGLREFTTEESLNLGNLLLKPFTSFKR